MGERGFSIKADNHKSKWETDSFPLLCESCLGENPYVRMMKEVHGAPCKICERPFTVFRWKPGKRSRYKKTEICQTCARMKNVCQTCILDLQYGLPVQVRDAFLSVEDKGPSTQSNANREWFAQQHDRLLEEQEESGTGSSGKAPRNRSLLKLARSQPYYKRNRAHLCTFYARGECTRGDECPYLHELPKESTDPLAHQSIKSRYEGENDPVAEKITKKALEAATEEKHAEPVKE